MSEFIPSYESLIKCLEYLTHDVENIMSTIETNISDAYKRDNLKRLIFDAKNSLRVIELNIKLLYPE
jgi:hypothetical protein